MKALDIIDALTRMGCTEATGLVETPENENEIQDWICDTFGGGYDSINYDRSLKPNTKYVYSYEDKLGDSAEDCLIEVGTTACDGQYYYTHSYMNIYLYEVE